MIRLIALLLVAYVLVVLMPRAIPALVMAGLLTIYPLQHAIATRALIAERPDSDWAKWDLAFLELMLMYIATALVLRLVTLALARLGCRPLAIHLIHSAGAL